MHASPRDQAYIHTYTSFSTKTLDILKLFHTTYPPNMLFCRLVNAKHSLVLMWFSAQAHFHLVYGFSAGVWSTIDAMEMIKLHLQDAHRKTA